MRFLTSFGSTRMLAATGYPASQISKTREAANAGTGDKDRGRNKRVAKIAGPASTSL